MSELQKPQTLVPTVGRQRDRQAGGDNKKHNGLQPNTGQIPSQNVETPSILKIPKVADFSQTGTSTGKGGGAMKSIDQKFQVNPSNGTMSLSMSIPLSATRNDFQPSLDLVYNSGSGNGPFGIGWTLASESVTRKTSKHIPKYDGTDTFILSGSDDLVPIQGQDPKEIDGYSVFRFGPRVEKEMAVIEQWTKIADPTEVYWRTISSSNVTKVFGRTDQSRVFETVSGKSNIFSWLLCEAYDPFGNAIMYSYKSENSQGVGDMHILKSCEASRENDVRIRERYLKSVRYGNRHPSRDLSNWDIVPQLAENDWMFEVILDYGEHDEDIPTTNELKSWNVRKDAFSSYTSGFEIRSYRLCRRILMFHHFPDHLHMQDCLVSSFSLSFREAHHGSFLQSASKVGYVWDGMQYQTQKTAPCTFEYSKLGESSSLSMKTKKSTLLNDLLNPGPAVSGQWLDLNGEGAPGLLVRDQGSWYYQRNENPVAANSSLEDDCSDNSANFGPVTPLELRPSGDSVGSAYFEDLDGNGAVDLVSLDDNGRLQGYHERKNSSEWSPLEQFTSVLNLNMNESHNKKLDVTGNGLADIFNVDPDTSTLSWYESQGKLGYAQEQRVYDHSSKIPQFLGPSGPQVTHVADMTGDGLADVVLIGNGRVSYWPNQGYGRFGTEIYMGNAPLFDSMEDADLQRVILADVDGSGTTDLIYLQRDGGIICYRNLCGNSWSDGNYIPSFPQVEDPTCIFVMDLLGKGTTCLCYVGSDDAGAEALVYYLDFANEAKPHLLTSFSNGIGLNTEISYAPSTKFYLSDERANTPWDTKLPFPVQVVHRVIEREHFSQVSTSTRYAYHDGYYDGREREFCGFAIVEQWTTEKTNLQNGNLYQKPTVHTRRWFHNGSPNLPTKPKGAFGKVLLSLIMPRLTSISDQDEAFRSIRGTLLRSEIYGPCRLGQPNIPYMVTEHSHEVLPLNNRLSPTGTSLFKVYPTENCTITYERQAKDPKIEHQLILERNCYGDVLKSLQAFYGKEDSDIDHGPTRVLQKAHHFTYTQVDYTNAVEDDNTYQKPLVSEIRESCIFGIEVNHVLHYGEMRRLDFNSFPTQTLEATEPLASHPCYLVPTRRSKSIYRKGDMTGPLPLGLLDPFSVVDRSYDLVVTQPLRSQAYGADKELYPGMPHETVMREAGLVDLEGDGCWWSPSATSFFTTPGSSSCQLSSARLSFYSPTSTTDQFGATSHVELDADRILPKCWKDAAGNISSVENDYRCMRPTDLTDPNLNRTCLLLDALGRVSATASSGKDTDDSEGDSLAGLASVTDEAVLDGFFKRPTSREAAAILGDATTRLLYCNGTNYSNDGRLISPTFVIQLSRTRHSRLHHTESTPNQTLMIIRYYDGRMCEIQTATLTTWDKAPLPWQISGLEICGLGARTIQKRRPFFAHDHFFETSSAITSPATVFFADALDRIVAILEPDHTWTKTCFRTWSKELLAVTDTVRITDPRKDSDVGHYFKTLSQSLFEPSWTDQAEAGDRWQKESAAKSLDYMTLPSVSHFDARGKELARYEKTINSSRRGLFRYDALGNRIAEIDVLGRLVQSNIYDMMGRRIARVNMELGRSCTVYTCLGEELIHFNERKISKKSVFDSLRRETEVWVAEPGKPDFLWSRVEYGESEPSRANTISKNQLGRIVRVWDQSGLRTNRMFNFMGNCTSSTVQFAREYRTSFSSTPDMALEERIYETHSVFDALGRETHHTDALGQTTYRQYNLLGAVAKLSTSADSQVWKSHVTGTEYTASGLASSITYGNGIQTIYTYDELSDRLLGKKSFRIDGKVLEHLTYTYDCVAKITHIDDHAHSDVYFRNRKVDASRDYSYDGFGRLVQSTGRKASNSGALGGSGSQQATDSDLPLDGNKLSRFTETYRYDDADNILSMKHKSDDEKSEAWTRNYEYAEIEASNRLASTSTGAQQESYKYDETGCMTSMSGFSHFTWDCFSKLRSSRRQRIHGPGSLAETTWFIYDSTGKRVRKVTDRSADDGVNVLKVKATYYLDSCELYRSFTGKENRVKSEILTNLVTDAQTAGSPLALFEKSLDGKSAKLWRYNLNTGLEVDDEGRIASYEEYSTFGATMLRACQNSIEAPSSYRYASYRRDTETDFYHCGARYYIPWLGRWMSPDPLDTVDGLNLFCYVANDPVNHVDPTGTTWGNAWKGGWNQAKEKIAEDFTGRAVCITAVKTAAALAGGYVASYVAEKANSNITDAATKLVINIAIDLAGGAIGYTVATAIQVSKAGLNAHRTGEVRTKKQIKKDEDMGQNARPGLGGATVLPQEAVALDGGVVISVTDSQQQEQKKWKDMEDANTALTLKVTEQENELQDARQKLSDAMKENDDLKKEIGLLKADKEKPGVVSQDIKVENLEITGSLVRSGVANSVTRGRNLNRSAIKQSTDRLNYSHRVRNVLFTNN